MGLLQLIYSSSCTDAMDAAKAFKSTCKNIGICQSLGVTGRVFADGKNALTIIEGEEDILREFYAMVEADKYVLSLVLHIEREINSREFSDYKVLLDLPTNHPFCEDVRPLSGDEIDRHITSGLSGKVRLIASSVLGSVVKLPPAQTMKVA